MKTTSSKTPNFSEQELLDKLTSLKSQNTEYLSDLQRTRADFENYRKQVELQKSQAKLTACHATVSKFLPLLDNLSLAFAAHAELAPLRGSLEKTLKELDLSIINSSEGTDFNPELHDAIAMEDGDGSREVIAETLRPGYLYRGETLRAALVKVKKV